MNLEFHNIYNVYYLIFPFGLLLHRLWNINEKKYQEVRSKKSVALEEGNARKVIKIGDF